MGEVVTGAFELHVFVSPLDPPPERARAFSEACQGDGTAPPMKGLLLALDYQDRGFVGVLQSSRYIRGALEDACREVEGDASRLEAAGFEVVRRKVEAVATSAGVPQTASDATRSPGDRYFEFHLLINAHSGPISNAQVASLRTIASDMSARLRQPVPLSYNALKPGQRFLNLRARGVGLEQAKLRVHELESLVAQTGELAVVKVISEYICFDDNRAIDNGWLEPL